MNIHKPINPLSWKSHTESISLQCEKLLDEKLKEEALNVKLYSQNRNLEQELSMHVLKPRERLSILFQNLGIVKTVKKRKKITSNDHRRVFNMVYRTRNKMFSIGTIFIIISANSKT